MFFCAWFNCAYSIGNLRKACALMAESTEVRTNDLDLRQWPANISHANQHYKQYHLVTINRIDAFFPVSPICGLQTRHFLVTQNINFQPKRESRRIHSLWSNCFRVYLYHKKRFLSRPLCDIVRILQMTYINFGDISIRSVWIWAGLSQSGDQL